MKMVRAFFSRKRKAFAPLIGNMKVYAILKKNLLEVLQDQGTDPVKYYLATKHFIIDALTFLSFDSH